MLRQEAQRGSELRGDAWALPRESMAVNSLQARVAQPCNRAGFEQSSLASLAEKKGLFSSSFGIILNAS